MITDAIFMVRPAAFGFDEETALSNAFQEKDDSLSREEIRTRAIEEFDEMVRRLRSAGVEVQVMQDSPRPPKPSAVFPNNWVSFHASGAVVTYPMATPSRQAERNEAFLEKLGCSFQLGQRIRLETFEKEQKYLESTGSLVLDQDKRIAYACRSLRTHPELVSYFCERFEYEAVYFDALDRQGDPIYHTNVVMAMGDTFALICLECIPEPEREMVDQKLRESGKEVVPINMAQMESFAGNMLLVQNRVGEKILVMSEQARKSLEPGQLLRLESHARLLDSPIYTIEKAGGGSARCMMAEIFLPRKKKME